LTLAQGALNDGVRHLARSMIAQFVSRAVTVSNLPARNVNRLDIGSANSLTCGASNVLTNIPTR
jgi:hypothetical protein